jgi:YD repeat-containing protein
MAMVAVVTGGSLGLNLGSGTVLGGAGVGGSASFGRQSDSVYVNAASGNLVIQTRDELLTGRGLDVAGLRTYNSLGTYVDDNGDNWQAGLVRKVWLGGGTVNAAGSYAYRRDEDGSEATFSWNAGLGRYVSTDGGGAADSLSYDGTNWTFVDGTSRTVEVYAGSTGRLLSSTDADGNSLSFAYNGAGLLASVTTPAGEITYYDYNGSNQLTQLRTVSKSSDSAGLDRTLTRVRYSYDASNRLATVTVDLSPEDNSVSDGRVFTTAYTYDGASKRVASITQSDGAKLSFTYDGSGRVQTVTDALGGVTTFGYDTGNRATTVTDALNQVTTYRYDANSQLLSVSAPAVGGVVSTISYQYDGTGNVTRITDAEGRAVVMDYDGAGNVVRQTDAAGNVVRRGYNAQNQLLMETVATAGEPASNTPATHYVYDSSGTRLRFSISAEGRVTEYRYNSLGQRTSSIQYTAAIYDMSGGTWWTQPGEADLTNWVNARDLTRTQRVDYAYDWRGQLARSTSYDSVDSAGNGQGGSLTQYVYDAAGQLLKTIDARSGVTQSTYDGLGRVLTVTNALNQISVNSYDDVGGTTRTTAFNGLTTTSTFDRLGRTTSVVESAATASSGFVASAGMTLDGSSLSKTSGDGAWNAGAYSKQGIAGGATVAFKPAQADKYLIVGLNTDAATDSDYRGIDWAMCCSVAGTIQIVESGTYIGEFGSYSAGDALSVSYDGTSVRYIKNGSVLRSVAVTITQPLYADSTFHSVGGKVTDLRFEPYGFTDGAFVGDGGVSVDGATAIKTGGVAGSWSSAVRSKVGYSGGASVSFSPAQADKYLMVGLNTDPASDASYSSIDWAFYCVGGGLQIYESGTFIGDFGTYAAGDKLAVSYDGTAIRYIKNGVVLRSVTTAIPQPLYADSSFHTAGGQVTDLVFTGGSALSGVKSYYDANSHLRMTQDATGNRQWYFYDEAGRLVGTVNALGQLTETVYNKTGQVTQTIAYANLVSLPSLVDGSGQPTNVSLANIRPATSTADTKAWNAYDSAGRLTRTVTPLGEVTEFTYDASGRLFLTRRYANTIATAGLGSAPALASIAPAASSQDRVVRSFYDNDGLQVGSLDATGALSETQYDAAARLVAKIQRTAFASASQISQATSVTTTLAQVRPGDSSSDLKTLNFYNARGQLVGQLDGEGGFAETVYDATGNVSQTLRYSLKATGFNTTSLLSSVRAAAGGVQSNTVFEYDLLNRVLKQRVDPNGRNLTTTSVFDDANGVLYVTAPNGATTQTQLDVLGRAIATTVDPNGLNLTTRTSYDANGHVSTITDPKGTVTLFTYDQLGRKASQTVDPAGINLVTVYQYDVNGNLARTIDPKGQQTRYLYDADNRLQYTLDAEYGLTEYRYDALGNQVQSIRYADKQAGIQTFDVANGLIRNGFVSISANVAKDQATRYVYDAAGRKRFNIDALGTVSESRYDAVGQLTQTLQYERAMRIGGTPTEAQMLAALSTATTGFTSNLEGWNGSAGVWEGGQLKLISQPDAGGTWAGMYSPRTLAAGASVKLDFTPTQLQQTTHVMLESVSGSYNRLAVIFRPDGQLTAQVAASNGQWREVGIGSYTAGTTYTIEIVSDASGGTLYVYAKGGARSSGASYVVTGEFDWQSIRTAMYTNRSPSMPGVTTAYVDNIEERAPEARITRYAYDTLGNLRFSIDALGGITETRYDCAGHAVSTLAYQQTVMIGNSFTEANLVAKLGTTVRTFDSALDGMSGSGGVWEAGQLKLISQPDAGGGWSGVASSRVLPAGSSIKFDYTPTQRQQYQQTMLESRDEIPYSRICVVFKPDGGINAQICDTTGKYREVFLGTYIAGKTYTVELTTTSTGGSVYVYDKGASRDSSLQASFEGVFAWKNIRANFAVNRAATLSGVTTAYVDNLEERGPEARVTQYTYDTAGRLRFAVDAEGYVSETRYDVASGTTTQLRYANRVSGASNYSAPAVPPALASFTSAYLATLGSSQSTVQTVDRAGRLSSETDGNGVLTQYSYDLASQLTSVTRAAGLPESTTTRYTYDAVGRMTSKTVADGAAAQATTRYEYDALGRVLYEYEARGIALSESDSAWATSERQRLGYAASIGSLSADQKTALRNLYRTSYAYDKVGHRVSATNAQGASSSTVYDASGNAVQVTDPLGNVGYFYFDALNRLSVQVDPEGNATKTSYVLNSRAAVATIRRYATKVSANPGTEPALTEAAKDAVTTNTYDRLDRLMLSVDAAGYAEGTEYGVNGNRFDKAITNKLGGRAVYRYDRRGQTVSETLPVQVGGQSVVNSFKYDAFGNRTQTIEAVGLAEQRTTTFRYDAAGRLTHRIGTAYTAVNAATQATSTVTPVEVTVYDALGRVIDDNTGATWNGSTASGGAHTYSYYDAANQLRARVAADGALTTYTYSPTGKVWQEADYANRVTLPSGPGGTPPSATADSSNDRVTTSLYDSLDRLIETRRDKVVYWEQPSDSNLISLNLPGNQPATLTLKKFLYDANGNVTQEVDARGNSAYSYYDKLGRKLLRIDQEGYATAWRYGDLFDTATQEIRYATRLSSYARQDDAGANPSLRDPAALTASLASSADRTTQFDLDRLGRVTQQSVLNVAYDYVDGNGALTRRITSAVTQYAYNGLGNVTHKQERVAELSDGTTSIWNNTDIQYDLLGREVRRQSPGYADYLGNAVRPTQDTEYDGLGHVSRTLQRGANDSVETDDRITRYGYDVNGNRNAVTDAAGNVTSHELDAMGNIARATSKAVKDADGNARDVVKLYQYDALGRIVQTTDAQTGEIRRTAYNAFGQLSAKGLGTGWQEFSQYNTLGQLQKSNAEDGSVKIYLYDANGNATRKISSAGTDLTNISVFAAAQDATLNHTFSVYDKRNQLIKTVQPDVSFLRDLVSQQQAFTQQLADLYGAVGLVNGAGGNYTPTTVDANGYRYTVVTGAGSGSALAGVGASSITGAGFWSAPALTAGAPSSLPPSSAWKFPLSTDWSTNVTGGGTGQGGPNLEVYIPSSYPAGQKYALRYKANDGSAVFLTGAAGTDPGAKVVVPTQGFSGLTLSVKVNGAWADIGTIAFSNISYTPYNTGPGVTNPPLHSSGTIAFTAKRDLLIPPSSGVASVAAYIGLATTGSTALSVRTLTDYTGATIAGWYAIDTSALANGTSAVSVMGMNAAGDRIMADTLSVTVSANGVTSTPASIANADVWTDGTRMHFRSATTGGSSGTVYWRLNSSMGDWSSASFSGGVFDLASRGLSSGVNYAFIVKVGGQETYGRFTLDGNGIPALDNNAMLVATSHGNRTLNFDFSGTVSDTSAASYTVDLTIGSTKVTKVLSGWAASVGVETDLGLGLSQYTNSANNFTYSYRLYAERSGVRQAVGQGNGSVQIGSEFSRSAANSVQAYQPLAVLNVPSGVSLAAGITLTPQDAPGTAATLAASGDWRRKQVNSTSATLDLSQWLNGSDRYIDLGYSASDSVFNGTYKLYADGHVDCVAMTVKTRQPKIPLTINGATQLVNLKVGPNDSSLASVPSSRWAISGSTFTWDASDQAGLGARRFYYEAADASGKTVGKGYGSFTLNADGTLSYSVDTPLLQPSTIRFTPPAATGSFVVKLRQQGTTGAYATFTSLPTDGTARLLEVVANGLVPSSGSTVYEVVYTGTDSSGATVSSGGGTITVASTGATTSNLAEDRKPTLATLQGPVGKNVPRLQLDVRANGSTGPYTSMFLNGSWSAAAHATLFTWDASAYTPLSGSQNYDYVLRMQNGDGSAYRNEVGDAIEVAGVMTLGGSSSAPVQMRQYVTQFAQAAQVSHRQSYNAFGEISEEYDDATLQRAQAMVALYGGTADASAVKTSFTYNALGKLLTKTDPQTNVTLANGYRYRTSPVTNYGYDLLGRLVTVTDANGNLSKQAYAGDGERLALQWAGDGGRKLTQYDGFGDARKLTDELGHVTQQDFDTLGRLVQAQRLSVTRVQNFTDANAVASTLTDTYAYDALGQRIQHTNTLGWSDKTYYDNLGRVTQTLSAQGLRTRYDYSFVDAGASGGILGTGGANTGGWQTTTTDATGRTTIDRNDYFGHLTWHQDQGGRQYTYSYDIGARLASQTSSAGQNIQYAYYANGYIKEAKDLAMRTLSRYGYDNAGNRVWEAYNRLASDNVNPDVAVNYQDSAITYDELNRIARLQDRHADVQYEYDAVGNRRTVRADYWDPTTLATLKTDEFWYSYDAANRFLITKGSIGSRATSAGATNTVLQGSQGTVLTYNQAGQRTSARNSDGSLETYSYATDGLLEDTQINGVLRARRRADALGRTLEYSERDASGNLTSTHIYTYDHDNRTLSDATATPGNTASDGTTRYYYNNDLADTASLATQGGSGALAKTVFTPNDANGTTVTTSYTYQYWDAAKQLTIKKQAANQGAPDWAPGLSSLSYDVNGYLKTAIDTTGGRTLNYVSNATGLVLARTEDRGAARFYHFWYYAGGRRIGDVTTDPTDTFRTSYAESLAKAEAQSKVSDADRYKDQRPVTSADFDQSYEPIGASYPGNTPGSFTVRSGDTLRSIAQSLWGDSALWYLIAQANGLTGSETLVAGQVLVVPNQVTNVHNNANTFRPYNPGEVIGHIDPTLPAPPPPPQADKGCGGIGTLIMVVVAVVATIYTAGAAAAYFSSGALAGGFSGGLAVLSGGAGLSAAAVGAAAVGAAVGSIASQGVGMLMGNVQKFSWKQVGQAAFGGAVTAGVGSALNSAGYLQTVSTTSSTQATLNAAGRATLSSAASMALKGDWNWRSIGISAISASAGSAMGNAVQDQSWAQVGNGIGQRLVSGLAGGLSARALTSGRKADYESIFASTLGNAIGESLAQPDDPLGDFINEKLADQDARDRAGLMADIGRQRLQALKALDAIPYFSDGKSSLLDRVRAKLGDIVDDVKDLALKGLDAIDLTKEPSLSDLKQQEAQRREVVRARLRNDGILDTGLACVPLDAYGTGNNPSSIGQATNPRAGTFEGAVAQGVADLAIMETGGQIVGFAGRVIRAEVSSARTAMFGERALTSGDLEAAMRAGLSVDLPISAGLAPLDASFGGASFTRYLNNVTNPEIRAAMLEQASSLRAELPVELQGKGNLAVARLDVPGLPDIMKAYSRFDSGELGYVAMPNGPRVFEPLAVDRYGAVNTTGSFLRDVDGEFKILETTAQKLGNNPAAVGRIDLFTELRACTSCGGAIVQFRARYPNIQLNVFTGKQ